MHPLRTAVYAAISIGFLRKLLSKVLTPSRAFTGKNGTLVYLNTPEREVNAIIVHAPLDDRDKAELGRELMQVFDRAEGVGVSSARPEYMHCIRLSDYGYSRVTSLACPVFAIRCAMGRLGLTGRYSLL